MKIKLLCLFIMLMINNSILYAFNNSNFNGSYSFRLVGTSSIVLANEPRTVATGIMIADGRGHITGHGSFRSAGSTCLGKISGTYTLSNDGTGLISSNFSTQTPGCFTSVLDLAIVLANKGNLFEVSNSENDYMSGTLTHQ